MLSIMALVICISTKLYREYQESLNPPNSLLKTFSEGGKLDVPIKDSNTRNTSHCHLKRG